MVREFPELQGIMGGVYARIEGQPEEVWKAIYFHYLPIGVEGDAPPTKAQLGKAAVTWAAVSLADKLDTLVGLFAAGEKPTGSRDPYGLRRAAQGVLRILVDLESLSGLSKRPTLNRMLDETYNTLGLEIASGEARNPLRLFLMDRLQHLMQTRGAGYEEVQTVTGGGIDRVAEISPVDLIEWAAEWKRVVGTAVFESAAEAHKRAKRIVAAERASMLERQGREQQAVTLSEPAEIALRENLDRVDAEISQALANRQPRKAVEAIASIQPIIGRFFDEVRVVVPDAQLKNARLSLLMDFDEAVSRFGDPSVFSKKQS
jgi:glycyl-tRNA synthetase beta chain